MVVCFCKCPSSVKSVSLKSPNRVLPRKHTGYIANTNNTREDATHGYCQMVNTKIRLIISLQPKMEKLYTVIKTRPRADCGSDHELLIGKFRLKLKKMEKATRPFRYDLNQIPYNYTVEVRNRFKGLDLRDRVPEELWAEVGDIVQEAGIKTIPKKKNAKRENGCLRRPYR